MPVQRASICFYYRVRHSPAVAAAHPLEFEVSRCRTSEFARAFLPAQFTRCFLPALVLMWNDLPFGVFDTRTLDGLKLGSSQALVASVCVFFNFPCAGACGVAKAISKQLINNFYN